MLRSRRVSFLAALALIPLGLAGSSSSARAEGEVSIAIASDSAIYKEGATAHFAITVTRRVGNQDLFVPLANERLVATFPGAASPVVLTQVDSTHWKLESVLAGEGDKTLTVTLLRGTGAAREALAASIERHEEVIEELKALLEGAPPKLARIIEHLIAVNEAIVAQLESVLACLSEPVATASRTIKVDGTAPVIANVIPEDGMELPVARPMITADLSDNMSGVDAASARVRVDGVLIPSEATEDSLSAQPEEPLADGSHALVIVVCDKVGNCAAHVSHFTTDTTAPIVSGLTPAQGSFVKTEKPTISASFSDATTGVDVASVKLVVAGSDVTASAQVSAAGVTYTPTTALAQGEVAVALEVADKVANKASAAWSFTVDSVPPVIADLAPETGSATNNQRPAFSGSFSDATSGVDAASVALTLDGADVTAQAEVSAAGFTFTAAANLAEGEHTLSVNVSDLAGNTATASTTLIVDITPPPAPVVAEIYATEDRVTLFGDSPPDVVEVLAEVTQGDAVVESAVIQSYSVVFLKGTTTTFAYSLRFKDKAGNIGPATVGTEAFQGALPEVIVAFEPLASGQYKFEEDGVYYTERGATAKKVQIAGRIVQDGEDTAVTFVVEGKESGRTAEYPGTIAAGLVFNSQVELFEELNEIRMLAVTPDGRTAEAATTLSIVSDRTPPELTQSTFDYESFEYWKWQKFVTNVPGKSYALSGSIADSGSGLDGGKSGVRVLDPQGSPLGALQPFGIDQDGNITGPSAAVGSGVENQEKLYTVELVATDRVGNETKLSVPVLVDRQAATAISAVYYGNGALLSVASARGDITSAGTGGIKLGQGKFFFPEMGKPSESGVDIAVTDWAGNAGTFHLAAPPPSPWGDGSEENPFTYTTTGPGVLALLAGYWYRMEVPTSMIPHLGEEGYRVDYGGYGVYLFHYEWEGDPPEYPEYQYQQHGEIGWYYRVYQFQDTNGDGFPDAWVCVDGLDANFQVHVWWRAPDPLEEEAPYLTETSVAIPRTDEAAPRVYPYHGIDVPVIFSAQGYAYDGGAGEVSVTRDASPGWVHGVTGPWYGPKLLNGIRVRPSTVAAGTTVDLHIRGADIADKGITLPDGITLDPEKPIRQYDDVVDLVDELVVPVAVAEECAVGLKDVTVGGDTLDDALNVVKIEIAGKELGSDNLPVPGAEFTRLIRNIHPVDCSLLRDVYVALGTPDGTALRRELEAQIFKVRIADAVSQDPEKKMDLRTDFEEARDMGLVVEGGVLVSEKPVILYYGELAAEIINYFSDEFTVLDADAALDNLTRAFTVVYDEVEAPTNVFRVAILRVDGSEISGPVPLAEPKEVLALYSRIQLQKAVPPGSGFTSLVNPFEVQVTFGANLSPSVRDRLIVGVQSNVNDFVLTATVTETTKDSFVFASEDGSVTVTIPASFRMSAESVDRTVVSVLVPQLVPTPVKKEVVETAINSRVLKSTHIYLSLALVRQPDGQVLRTGQVDALTATYMIGDEAQQELILTETEPDSKIFVDNIEEPSVSVKVTRMTGFDPTKADDMMVALTAGTDFADEPVDIMENATDSLVFATSAVCAPLVDSTPAKWPVFVSTSQGYEPAEVMVTPVNPWEALLAQGFRVRIYGDMEDSDRVVLPVGIREEPGTTDVRFERTADRVMTSQPVIKVRGGVSELGSFFDEHNVAAFGGPGDGCFTLMTETYATFRGRKLSDTYDLYLFGFFIGSGDRHISLTCSHDGNYSANTSVFSSWPKESDKGVATYIAIGKEKYDNVAQTEAEREEVLQASFNLNPKWGPWDPHDKDVLPLIKENLTPEKFAGKKVALISHGAEAGVRGNNPAWEHLGSDFCFTKKEHFEEARKYSSPVGLDDFFSADGSPFRPTFMLVASCGGWKDFVEAMKARNTGLPHDKRWAAPLAAVDGPVSCRFAPILGFVDGTGEQTKYSIASEFWALWCGIFIEVESPGGAALDPKDLPQQLLVRKFGPLRTWGNAPEDDPRKPNLIRIDEAGQPPTYGVSWLDVFTGGPNVATLTFSNDPDEIASCDDGGTLVKVTLQSTAHGIHAPFRFWLRIKGATATSAAAVISPELKAGFAMAVGPGLRSLQEFGAAWSDIFQNNPRLTHAYWDIAYEDNKYLPFASIPEAGTVLASERRKKYPPFMKESFLSEGK